MVPGIGVALVFFTIVFRVRPVLQVGSAITEHRARAALACLTIAEIHAVGFLRGSDAERPAMALPDPHHRGLSK